MKSFQMLTAGCVLVCTNWIALAQRPVVKVRADQVVHGISRYLTGACIEDVNHEIYGGLYSQMLFGESFQEPPFSPPLQGFTSFGGVWAVTNGVLQGSAGDGPKLLSQTEPFAIGEAGVEVWLAKTAGGNAGLIVKVSRPGLGADTFEGYEISLDASAQVVRLGRHRHNWELIRDTPWPVPAGEWVSLVARLTENSVEVLVNGRSVVRHEERKGILGKGTVGLRQWQRDAMYRNLWVQTGGKRFALPFLEPKEDFGSVSGMWRPIKHGSAEGRCQLERDRPFKGIQSQRMECTRSGGEYGIENRGLNRVGLAVQSGRAYEGLVWARSPSPVELVAAFESADGQKVYGSTSVRVTENEWRKYEFKLTPSQSDPTCRFALKLKEPGSVVLGYALVQPGVWGRFKGLPVRRDVVEALIDQGITVLRYGGSMVNAPEYRWKKMIGPPDRRPPYRGTWYPHSSNGWGILDFLDLCQAAGFLSIPAFNMDETPQDMADFIEYVNAPADSSWGARRAELRRGAYAQKHIQLGNEERVDANYYKKFKGLAEAIWARDRDVVLVVGDFAYGREISDPKRISGAASGIKDLSAHESILALAKEHGREVWFDVHVGTEGPGASGDLLALPSYVAALQKLARGARHQVVVFEFNAGNHQQRRALGNALAIQTIERLGTIPIATSANCLQPDGQNDNGWDQGLLFLNPSKVWLQPPGYVTRMISSHYQPLLVQSEIEGSQAGLHVVATQSHDGKVLVLQSVNCSPSKMELEVQLAGFTPGGQQVAIEQLAAPLNAVNTAEQPHTVTPARKRVAIGRDGRFACILAPHSFTVMQVE